MRAPAERTRAPVHLRRIPLPGAIATLDRWFALNPAGRELGSWQVRTRPPSAPPPRLADQATEGCPPNRAARRLPSFSTAYLWGLPVSGVQPHRLLPAIVRLRDQAVHVTRAECPVLDGRE